MTPNKPAIPYVAAATPTALHPSASAPPPTSSTKVSVQLQALEKSCGYGDPLTNDVRVTRENLIRRVPAAIVDRVIALAARGKGTVAGITFDPVAAKAKLAAADEADAVAVAALMLVRRAHDQAIRLRAEVTGDASGIRTALRGYVKTTQGAHLAQANDELRSLARQHAAAAKARRTRVETAVKSAVSSATAERAEGTPEAEPASKTT
jgi:hypothetical protein